MTHIVETFNGWDDDPIRSLEQARDGVRDRDLKYIFAVQDEITHTIAGTLGASIQHAERSRVLRKKPASLDAYEHVQRAAAFTYRFTKSSVDEARRDCQAAIAIDPDYAPAYTTLAIIRAAAAACGSPRS